MNAMMWANNWKLKPERTKVLCVPSLELKRFCTGLQSPGRIRLF